MFAFEKIFICFFFLILVLFLSLSLYQEYKTRNCELNRPRDKVSLKEILRTKGESLTSMQIRSKSLACKMFK